MGSRKSTLTLTWLDPTHNPCGLTQPVTIPISVLPVMCWQFYELNDLLSVCPYLIDALILFTV
jgi:hypothetical protein